MAEELVGASEAASRLAVTPERIRQLARARELPAPAGKIGRQDVWRWPDLASWAVATGRLPASLGEGRQAVRAWQPVVAAMRKVVDEVMVWDGGRALTHVRIWEPEADTAEPAVVVIGNLEDSDGMSATNAIEDVAMLVAARHLGARGLQAQFYDHWSRGPADAPTYAHVTFTVAPPDGTVRPRRGIDRATVRTLGGALASPRWRETDAQEVERLIGEPLHGFTAGTYTAAMVNTVRDHPDTPISALWDPEGAVYAAAAYGWLTDTGAASPGCALRRESYVGAARQVLAWHAVTGRERAARDIAWQEPDAPVLLVLPELPHANDLRVAATAATYVGHELVWQVLGEARRELAAADPVDGQSLVPARHGGLTRLAWWEAGTPEPVDPRDGVLGRVVTPSDVLGPLGVRTGDQGLDDVSLVRAVERAASYWLQEHCEAVDDWDVPSARPAGPFRTGGATCERYLATVRWHEPRPGDRPRLARLAALGRPSSPGARRRGKHPTAGAGTDPAGRLVALSRDRKTYSLEWPVGPGPDLTASETLPDAVVRADQHRQGGNAPVFVELPDGPVLPLPSRAGWGTGHEYTWGYSGTGPTNLAAAVTDLALRAAVAAGVPADADDVARAVRGRVRSGRTPAWPIRQILDEALSGQP